MPTEASRLLVIAGYEHPSAKEAVMILADGDADGFFILMMLVVVVGVGWQWIADRVDKDEH